MILLISVSIHLFRNVRDIRTSLVRTRLYEFPVNTNTISVHFKAFEVSKINFTFKNEIIDVSRLYNFLIFTNVFYFQFFFLICCRNNHFCEILTDQSAFPV